MSLSSARLLTLAATPVPTGTGPNANAGMYISYGRDCDSSTNVCLAEWFFYHTNGPSVPFDECLAIGSYVATPGGQDMSDTATYWPTNVTMADGAVPGETRCSYLGAGANNNGTLQCSGWEAALLCRVDTVQRHDTRHCVIQAFPNNVTWEFTMLMYCEYTK